MGCSASKKESTLVHEATEEIREGPFRTKFDAMINARDAITADLKNDAAVDALIETYEKAIGGIKATLTTEPAPADAAYDESKFVLSSAEREEFESLLKAHVARVEALRACRAAPKPKPMASTPLEAEALALLEKQREGLSWSVSETDASGRPMPI